MSTHFFFFFLVSLTQHQGKRTVGDFGDIFFFSTHTTQSKRGRKKRKLEKDCFIYILFLMKSRYRGC